jgi:hypothetical protein
MPSITSQGRVSSFPGGFPAGLSVLGTPLVFPGARGEVYYVSNSTASLAPGQSAGSASGKGTFNKPFSTLQQAVNSCVANRGDIIIVCPGHAENIASSTALAIDKAGISIIGVGMGDSRPTFTLTTANTAKIVVSASNVSICNCIFAANFLNIAVLFDLTTAKGFNFDDCEVRDTSAILNFLNLFQLSATSNANDGLRITQSEFFLKSAAGVANLVSFRGTIDRVNISYNYYSALTTNAGAVLVGATGKAITNLLVLNNVFNLVNAAGTATGYLLTSDTTGSGYFDGNKDFCLSNTTYASSLQVTAGRSFRFGQNWHSRTADKSPGTVLPAADS